MVNLSRTLIGALALPLLLSACGDQEVLLEGERLELHTGAPVGIGTETVNQALPLSLSTAATNAAWTHVGGNAQHNLEHPALARDISPIWSADIGAGNGKRHRITADPVVSDGRIYTLDAEARVMAHTTSGKPLWSHDLTPSSDRSNEASGGGLAVSGGTVFVTSAFGTLTALEAASGETIWTQDLESAATGAPTVDNGVVYLVTRNSLGWAIDAGNGRILWQVLGTPSDSGITGGPSPAVAGALVIFPFSSGQLIAAVANTGTQAWAASVAGGRTDRIFSRYSDLTGDPVVSGNVVYAGNHSGRLAGFETATGSSIWRANEGAIGPVWLAGGSLFVVSDENRLLRIDALTGEIIWAEELPFFTKTRIKRRKSIYTHYGPVLAGGRLVLVSDDGGMRQYDPVTGSLISNTELPDGAATNPVVAGGTMYLVTENGQLHAFR